MITMENKDQFIEEYHRYVCEEMSAAAAAIRQGIVEIVPRVVMLLTTGSELEKYVCGDPRIDLSGEISHLLTHSLTYSLTYLLTHSLTHLLTYFTQKS